MDLSELDLAKFESIKECRDYLVNIWQDQMSSRPQNQKTFVEWLGEQGIKGQYEENTEIVIQDRGKTISKIGNCNRYTNSPSTIK